MNKGDATNSLSHRRKGHRELAVALVSGGMDSCVTAATAAQEYEMAFLHVSYGCVALIYLWRARGGTVELSRLNFY